MKVVFEAEGEDGTIVEITADENATNDELAALAEVELAKARQQSRQNQQVPPSPVPPSPVPAMTQAAQIPVDDQGMVLIPDEMGVPSMRNYEMEDQYGNAVTVYAKEGTSPEQLSALAEQQIQRDRPDASREYIGGVLREAGPAAMGAGAGLALGGPPGAAAGLVAGATVIPAHDFIIDRVNSTLGTHYTKAEDALSHLLTQAGFPEPKSGAAKIVQQAARGAVFGASFPAAAEVALSRMATGAQPVSATRGTLESLAAAPEIQAIAGAGGGAAAEVAAQSGADPITQFVASMLGGMTTAGFASRLRPGNVPLYSQQQIDDADAAIAAGERHGVTVKTTDVLPPTPGGMIDTLRKVADRIPIAGTGSITAAQQNAISTIPEQLKREYGGPNGFSPTVDKISSLFTSKFREDLGKFQTQKARVISNVPRTPVPLTNTLKELDRQIAKAKTRKTPDGAEAEKELRAIRKELVKGKKTLKDLEDYRSDVLSSSFKSPTRNAPNEFGESAIRNLYGPFKKDMSEFISTHGGQQALTDWSKANQWLSRSMVEQENIPALRKAVKLGSLDQADESMVRDALASIIKSEKQGQLKSLYRYLPEEGRNLMKTAVIADAAEKSASQGGGPLTFVNDIMRRGEATGIFFNAQEARRLKGVESLIRLTQRQEGKQDDLYPWAAGAGLFGALKDTSMAEDFGAAGAAAISMGITGLAMRAYESKASRDLLLQLAKAGAGTKEELAIAKRLISSLSVAAPNEEPTKTEKETSK